MKRVRDVKGAEKVVGDMLNFMLCVFEDRNISM